MESALFGFKFFDLDPELSLFLIMNLNFFKFLNRVLEFTVADVRSRIADIDLLLSSILGELAGLFVLPCDQIA